jgi:hypothetical protein
MTNHFFPDVVECRRLIKRIDELLHDGNSEEGHRELHELAHELEKVLMQAMMGGPPRRRQTALRVRGRGFETVELDEAGNVIEPLRCICGAAVIHYNPKCPFYCMTT